MIAQLDPQYLKMRPTKAITRLVSQFLFEGRSVPARWQWTNHISTVFLKVGLHVPGVKTVKKPILILGTGRSGTTILGKVLSMHRDIGLLNEPKLLWHIAYADEDLAGSYSRGIAYYRLGAEAATEKVCRTIRHMYGFYLTCVRCERVLDKYPEMIFRVPFVLSILPDAKFVLIVRNGSDTAHSIAWWSQQYSRVAKNGDTYTWWGVNNRKWNLLLEQLVATDPLLGPFYSDIQCFSQEIDKAAVEWIVSMREGLRVMEQFPQHVHLVQYEKLVAHPERTLYRVMDFCDLPRDETAVAYASRILYPQPPKPPLNLAHSIVPVFEDTMKLVGYL